MKLKFGLEHILCYMKLSGFSEESYANLRYAVVPILKTNGENAVESLGTGFFVSSNGLFVTAKHVLMDVVGKDGLPKAALFVEQFLPGDKCLHRNIFRFFAHNIADLAIGMLNPMRDRNTNGLLVNSILSLTHDVPYVGDPIITFAYPHTEVVESGGQNSVYVNPAEYVGGIVETFPNGRDRVMLPSPCYRTNMKIPHGASGGPVFDKKGNVFGVNSTGIDGTDDSFVSAIGPFFSMEIDSASVSGMAEGGRISMAALEKLGKILVE